MSSREESIISFVDKHFKNHIDKDVYLFVKELYEYVSFMYDGSVNTIDFTSESESSEEESIEEKVKVNIDKDGFYSLK